MHIKTIDEAPWHTRELWIDDETKVGWLGVLDFTMRVGVAEIRVAGIGGVHTEREHRMKGYMRHLLEDTVQYMTAEGYDVSMLYGIPNFYTRFGYATSMPKHRFTIQTRDAEAAVAQAPTFASRPIEEKDMHAIVALYNTNNAERTCSMVRDPDTYTRFRMGTTWGTTPVTRLWEDADGQLLGYAVWDENRTAVKVAEVGAADDRLFPAMLATFTQEAIQKRCETITVYAPPDDPFAVYAQRFGTAWTIEYPRYSDGMARIMNQGRLFENLIPELRRRTVGQAPLIPFALTTELGSITLIPKDGDLHVEEGIVVGTQVLLPQDKLMQLILGYRSVRDVGNAPDVTIPDPARPTLTALFPRGTAFMWRPDYF